MYIHELGMALHYISLLEDTNISDSSILFPAISILSLTIRSERAEVSLLGRGECIPQATRLTLSSTIGVQEWSKSSHP